MVGSAPSFQMQFSAIGTFHVNQGLKNSVEMLISC